MEHMALYFIPVVLRSNISLSKSTLFPLVMKSFSGSEIATFASSILFGVIVKCSLLELGLIF